MELPLLELEHLAITSQWDLITQKEDEQKARRNGLHCYAALGVVIPVLVPEFDSRQKHNHPLWSSCPALRVHVLNVIQNYRCGKVINLVRQYMVDVDGIGNIVGYVWNNE
jgi:hypothetical protein